ncbi:MAG TPA: hypothetical protein VEQ84_13365 [Vicinamibacteria bacterium]|nr:hypothetical protein [Vicinamibacteria bacterium]
MTPGEAGIAIPFLFPLYRWIIRKTDGPAAPCPEIGAEDNGAQLALLESRNLQLRGFGGPRPTPIESTFARSQSLAGGRK